MSRAQAVEVHGGAVKSWAKAWIFGTLALIPMLTWAGVGTEIIPPLSELKSDRPRLLLRPAGTDRVVTLEQLRSIPHDADFDAMLDQLRHQSSAAAQAMVWLLTGDKTAADAAVARLRGFKPSASPNSFDVYFGLRELALAYDWLHSYEGFTPEARAEARQKAAPLAEAGLRIGDDHLFHNYVWQASGGVMLWALATAGEDESSNALYAEIRNRFETRLLPGLEYLDGVPGEPLWYWALYDLSPAALSLLAAQSASDHDVFGGIAARHGDFLARQFEYLMVSTCPDLSYTPFGDTKNGPDGGVTHEMAGVLCGAAWALKSGDGAWFDPWIARKRGLKRFYGETAIFYFLYARRLTARPVEPPLALLAGGAQGGHFVARSGWDDDATVVALRCTDHFGDHNHYDQGSFIIYRHGMLAVDQRAYKKVNGPQQATETHNTLIIGGRGQRAVHGQNFRTLEAFKANLNSGARLETGDILFHHIEKDWAAVSGQFAQAYPEATVGSCVRQLLFIRPATVVVVDRLAAPADGKLGEVRWLIHVPAGAKADATALLATNAASFLRCRELLPGGTVPERSKALEASCERCAFAAQGESALTLVHVLETGDGIPPATPAPASAALATDGKLNVVAAGREFMFDPAPGFAVTPSL